MASSTASTSDGCGGSKGGGTERQITALFLHKLKVATAELMLHISDMMFGDQSEAWISDFIDNGAFGSVNKVDNLQELTLAVAAVTEGRDMWSSL